MLANQRLDLTVGKYPQVRILCQHPFIFLHGLLNPRLQKARVRLHRLALGRLLLRWRHHFVQGTVLNQVLVFSPKLIYLGLLCLEFSHELLFTILTLPYEF